MRTAATQSALLRGHPRAEIRTPYGPCQNKKNYLTSEDKGSLVFVGAEEGGLGVGIPGEHPLHQDILGVLHTANHHTVKIWHNQSEISAIGFWTNYSNGPLIFVACQDS